jgi:hypothetical protein
MPQCHAENKQGRDLRPAIAARSVFESNLTAVEGRGGFVTANEP